ncbi:uncharacterized protein LOC121731132 [Aricia agestis]|uniref:uncharacterized protein LOC121731132 n=1 Tax=Aricia agestis TaxID=91739 RepID=UPI001C205F6C|nr:uncharacterized protein LOC121731132 [Aricia agestis]
MYHVVALCVFLLHIHTCMSCVDVLCILDGHAEPLCKTMLKHDCKESWCGYSGSQQEQVESRRDTKYRCLYANGQQLCREENKRSITFEKPDGSSHSYSRPN